jgi:hypothetical protein
MLVRNPGLDLMELVEPFQAALLERPREMTPPTLSSGRGWSAADLGLFNLKERFAVNSLYFAASTISG